MLASVPGGLRDINNYYSRILTCKMCLDPLSGGFWRIPTSVLDQSLHNDTVADGLGQYVEPFASIATTGGTAIDGDGNIYSGNTDLNSSTFSYHSVFSVIEKKVVPYSQIANTLPHFANQLLASHANITKWNS